MEKVVLELGMSMEGTMGNRYVRTSVGCAL